MIQHVGDGIDGDLSLQRLELVDNNNHHHNDRARSTARISNAHEHDNDDESELDDDDEENNLPADLHGSTPSTSKKKKKKKKKRKTKGILQPIEETEEQSRYWKNQISSSTETIQVFPYSFLDQVSKPYHSGPCCWSSVYLAGKEQKKTHFFSLCQSNDSINILYTPSCHLSLQTTNLRSTDPNHTGRLLLRSVVKDDFQGIVRIKCDPVVQRTQL